MYFSCVEDFETVAKEKLEKQAYDYYRSGAGDEVTLALNKRAYDRIRIIPRVLRDVATLDTSCTVLGMQFALPIGIAPTAMQKMANYEGEVATAKAAGRNQIPYTLSTIATSSIEEVAQGASDTTKWFQLYIYKDREITKSLLQRAEKCGFRAILLTVDAPVFGIRRADVRNKFKMPSHLRMANFEETDKATGVKAIEGGSGSGINDYVTKQFDPTLNWDDVKWLISYTKLPVLVKGVLSTADAIKCMEIGCKGIIVSNHGARQLDTVPATIEVLPEIVAAVGGRMAIIIDGGVRRGSDIFKALALGADMVLLGRPIIWGLAVNGVEGVNDVINLVRMEFESTMRLAGTRTLSDITRDYVVHKSQFAKL